jgi:hypothetical protein
MCCWMENFILVCVQNLSLGPVDISNTLKAPERVYIAKCMYGRFKTEGRPEFHERPRSQC